jgi:phage I-like protein
MATSYGYWVDLQATPLSDIDDSGAWIQAFPEGTYQHPLFGEMKFDASRLQRFAAGVATNVRGTDLDIDYDHKMHTGEAAGWVREAEYRPGQGLHIKVDWTPKAREAIKNGEYRYFSPEFMDEWTHPKTGKTHKDVLNGGALTNRPFLKDILPVNLSELMHDDQLNNPPSNEGNLMDPKELRKALGLAESATDAEVTAKLTELRQLHTVLQSTPNPGTPPTPSPSPAPQPPAPTPTPTPTTPPVEQRTVQQMLAELSDVNKDHPAVKMLTQIMEQQRTTIEQQQKALREIEVENILSELDRGKKFAVPPAVTEQLREILLKSSKEFGEQVYSAYKATLELGVVDLNEHGWQRRGEAVSASQALNAEVAKLMEADKNLSYRDAYDEVARQRPDLAQAVREDSYIKGGA